MATVRKGTVPMGVQLSYATRLKIILGILGRVRDFRWFRSPLHRFRSLHFIRWVLIDDDSRLLFTSEFDHSWEKYVHQLMEIGPSLVDLIWIHTDEYERGTASDVDRLSAWVRAHQIETNAFFAAMPDATVRDIQQYERLKQEVDDFFVRLGQDDLHQVTDASARLAQLRTRVRELHECRYLIGKMVREDFFSSGAWCPEAEREYTQVEQAFGSLRLYFAGSEQELFEAAFREFMGAEWFEHKRQKTGAPSPLSRAHTGLWSAASAQALLGTIQGPIIRGYPDLDWGMVLFYRIDEADAGAAFLGSIADIVTTAECEPIDCAVNVALAQSAFEALGFGRDVAVAFPGEFCMGMARRAAALGDGGDNVSESWRAPLRQGSEHERIALEAVDVVVFAYGRSEVALESTARVIADRAERAGIVLLGRERTRRQRDGAGREIEPLFGFRDGLSQPRIVGIDSSAPGEPPPSALGEFVLGHARNDGKRSTIPRLDGMGLSALYENGSFVAVRKLSRRPEADEWTDGQDLEILLGRRRDGTPLIETRPDEECVNAFDYSNDSSGAQCPLAAHARRANPRFRQPHPDGRSPRIVRRIMPEWDAGRSCASMLFMAFNSSLSLQYELLQAWINGANISDGFSTEGDPIASTNGNANVFMYRALDGHLRTVRVPPLVRLEWGMYLFAPSPRALADIAGIRRRSEGALARDAGDASVAVETAPASGIGPRARARVLFGDAAQLERILTEQPTAGQVGESVWKVVEALGGIVESAYGVLVSNAEIVRRILEQDGTAFSVVEYGRRMQATLGEVAYLGQDYGEARPEAARRVLDLLGRKETIERARRGAETYARAYVRKRFEQASSTGQKPSIHLPPLLQAVLPHVVAEVLGSRWDEAEGRWLVPLALDVAGYLFNPHLTATGRLPGREANAIGGDAITLETNVRRSAEMLTGLCAGSAASNGEGATVRGELSGLASDALFATVALGATAPTAGTFNNLLRHWIAEGDFARIRSRVTEIRAGAVTVSAERLRNEILGGMQRNPLPGVLYRTCKTPVRIGNVAIEPGQVVILRLSQCLAGGRANSFGLVFGHGVHACPGAEFGLAVIEAVIAVLFGLPNARPWPGRLAISFDGLDAATQAP